MELAGREGMWESIYNIRLWRKDSRILALQITGFIILDKLLKLSKPSFPSRQNENDEKSTSSGFCENISYNAYYPGPGT